MSSLFIFLWKVVHCHMFDCEKRDHSHRMHFSIKIRYFSIVFVCKHGLDGCAMLASSVFCSASCMSAAFFVRLKEFQLLYAAPLINVSFTAVAQSEELGGGASVASFCLQ